MQRTRHLKTVFSSTFAVAVVLCYATLTVKNHAGFSAALGTAVIACVAYLAQIAIRSRAGKRRAKAGVNDAGSTGEVLLVGFAFAAAAAMTVAVVNGMWGSDRTPKVVAYAPIMAVAVANVLCIADSISSSRQQHSTSIS